MVELVLTDKLEDYMNTIYSISNRFGLKGYARLLFQQNTNLNKLINKILSNCDNILYSENKFVSLSNKEKVVYIGNKDNIGFLSYEAKAIIAMYFGKENDIIIDNFRDESINILFEAAAKSEYNITLVASHKIKIPTSVFPLVIKINNKVIIANNYEEAKEIINTCNLLKEKMIIKKVDIKYDEPQQGDIVLDTDGEVLVYFGIKRTGVPVLYSIDKIFIYEDRYNLERVMYIQDFKQIRIRIDEDINEMLHKGINKNKIRCYNTLNIFNNVMGHIKLEKLLTWETKNSLLGISDGDIRYALRKNKIDKNYIDISSNKLILGRIYVRDVNSIGTEDELDNILIYIGKENESYKFIMLQGFTGVKGSKGLIQNINELNTEIESEFKENIIGCYMFTYSITNVKAYNFLQYSFLNKIVIDTNKIKR